MKISNEKAKSYRRQTTNVVNYPNYLKHVTKKLTFNIEVTVTMK